MDAPFVFSGSPNDSLLIVDGQIIGWGKPKAKYQFQMWRDIPSHVIHYRNLVNLQDHFLSDFNLQPIDAPKGDHFRYDFLAIGTDVPPGFWLKFQAGVLSDREQGYIGNIVYNEYNPEINNLDTYNIYSDRLYLPFNELFILLVNLGSSTGSQEILDKRSDNVLVGNNNEDDRTRRDFNERFYRTYIEYIKSELFHDPSTFIPNFLRLSGGHFLAYLSSINGDLFDIVIDTLYTSKNINPVLLSSYILELTSDNPDFNELVIKLRKENSEFISSTSSDFFFNRHPLN